MGFVIEWLCYLIAFVAGSAVAGLIATVVMKRGARRRASVDASDPRVGEGR